MYTLTIRKLTNLSHKHIQNENLSLHKDKRGESENSYDQKL